MKEILFRRIIKKELSNYVTYIGYVLRRLCVNDMNHQESQA